MAGRRGAPVLGLLPRHAANVAAVPAEDRSPDARRTPHPARSGGPAKKPGRLPARLWRRRQRPHRHRPALGAAAARHRFRLAARAGTLRRVADGPAVVPADLRRPARAQARRRSRPRRRSTPSSTPSSPASASATRDLALVGFSQGTMMALHVGPRRQTPIAGIVGYSGLLAGAGAPRAPRRAASRRCCWSTAMPTR